MMLRAALPACRIAAGAALPAALCGCDLPNQGGSCRLPTMCQGTGASAVSGLCQRADLGRGGHRQGLTAGGRHCQAVAAPGSHAAVSTLWDRGELCQGHLLAAAAAKEQLLPSPGCAFTFGAGCMLKAALMLLPRDCNCYIASHVCQTEAAISINCGLQIKADLLMRHTVLDPRIATLIEPWQEYQAVQMRLQVKCSKLCPFCCFGLQASV